MESDGVKEKRKTGGRGLFGLASGNLKDSVAYLITAITPLMLLCGDIIMISELPRRGWLHVTYTICSQPTPNLEIT